MTTRRLIGAVMTVSLMLTWLLATPAYAAIYWDDEMQVFSGSGSVGSATFGAITNNNVNNSHTVDTVVKYSGTASLRYNYPDICQNSVGQACGDWTDRRFPETNEHYGRVYLRVSQNFQWGAPNGQSKIWGVRSETGDTKGWFNFYFSLGMIYSAENTPTSGSTTNLPKIPPNNAQGNVGAMPREQWVCFEWHMKMNNPGGTANGILETWMNGIQTSSSNNVTWKGVSGTSTGWGLIRMYRQSGGPQQLGAGQTAHIWFDRLAVGNTRIGCIGGSGSGDTTPPGTPAGWTVY